eukprot:CAMPEP_0116871824 /NCGR_PEP_ID=MMETSP0463-20121206/2327_1 /TAXON_ID=181622 /ORGANISM="Strombidinopsis sp, Strain SopsisLIS2011" /LENGTH=171 /DNA_ID=CAMNT_0004510937 /DNA_START=43 /DNA_END=559 /DNA_ORIENTATION=-
MRTTNAGHTVMVSGQAGFHYNQGSVNHHSRLILTRLSSLFVSVLSLVVLVLLHTGDELAETKVLDHLLENWVSDLDVLNLDLGSIRDEVHLALTLLLLKTERDTTDGTLLDSLHQVSGETSNLVSESLGLNDSNVINDTLVGVEVNGELTVVLLDDGSGGSLNSLYSNSSL